MQKNTCLIIATLCSIATIAADFEKRIVLLGNPGSGKSTFFNAIAGEYIAVSGLSMGRGLTRRAQVSSVDGFTIIDTPGFADIENEDEIAFEIETSLQAIAYFHLIFVLNLRAGRVIPQDCDTINKIVDAIDMPNKKYSVIFNRITVEEKEAIFDVSANYQEFIREFTRELHHKPNAIKLIEFDPTLSNRKSDLLKLDSALHSFIFSVNNQFIISRIKKISTKKIRQQDIERKQRELNGLKQQQKNNAVEYQRLQERLRHAESDTCTLL